MVATLEEEAQAVERVAVARKKDAACAFKSAQVSSHLSMLPLRELAGVISEIHADKEAAELMKKTFSTPYPLRPTSVAREDVEHALDHDNAGNTQLAEATDRIRD
ncbi:hypothetical protein Tdes44962_MAKER09789 [Teratosphaeria destructans]|uniref:Uncharacterized protein n=1 Tax=Teratosphaeria destructans TaxID=418781 RepID=A0A9W7SS04_9PEZI|nr:hypothetical protein Tdes44962_MAKER09789 [Teratosphaeria destructans]